jgi:hypothetical protein
MRSLQQREDSEACSYISQPMGRPPLQRLLWQASLRKMRDGRLDGTGYRVMENGAHTGMEATGWKVNVSDDHLLLKTVFGLDPIMRVIFGAQILELEQTVRGGVVANVVK